MATKATRLPSRSWRVRAFEDRGDGKQHYRSFTAPTRKEAEYLAARFAMDQKQRTNPARMTVKAAYLAADYRLSCLADRRISKVR